MAGQKFFSDFSSFVVSYARSDNFPTGPFIIVKPRGQDIDECYVVPDFEGS